MSLSSLPERPRLRPLYYLVPMPSGRIQLRSAHRAVVITGAGAPELVNVLFPLLDGTRTYEEIVHSCREHSPAAVEGVLRLLHEKALVEDAALDGESVLSEAEREAWAEQIRLFSIFMSGAVRCQAELRGRRVAVLGLGRLGAAAAEQLAACGIGTLELLPRNPTEADAAERVATLCREVNLGTTVSVAASPRATWDTETLVELVRHQDLIIVCSDGPASVHARAVNEAALKAAVPWLLVVLLGNEVGLGPLVLPGETACFVCYELRMKGNLVFADEYIAFEEHLAKNGGDGFPRAGLRPYAPILGGLVALETVKFLTKFAYPITFGRLVRFNFLNYQFTVHPVLRLPRCPACGLATPVIKEWER